MSKFPAIVTRRSGRAPSEGRGNGKDYHVVAIVMKDGSSLLIKRYGRSGQFGAGWMVEQFDTVTDVSRAFEAIVRKKFDNHYSTPIKNRPDRHDISDRDDLVKEVGIEVFGKLTPSEVKHLLGDDADVLGHKERMARKVVGFNNGEPVYADDPRRYEFSKPVVNIPTVQERVAKNDKWGMF